TCGEGGAVVTNSRSYAENADKYQDHGHDHLGNESGAETHPFLGYNYRISELHAAVGLGQLEKFEDVLKKQKQYYTILREELRSIPEVTFRRVPQDGEESHAFLNFFLPDEDTTRKAHKAISNAGIDACFYWFDNNWHYYKKWEHLTEQKSLGRLPSDVRANLQDFKTTDFSASDAWMSRTISSLIKVGWTEDEMKHRAQQLKQAILSVL
ncbi:MAG: L-glutamine--2-deoxy-scyllo-inosose aminotransferase KanB, partial [Croceibacter sp.]|nr:L-glutamine--2-deoxy-scyllo-inosose aminotransferase KanB [Croceibacter sp.]